MTSGNGFVAGAVLLQHVFERCTFCGYRARRVRGMLVKMRLSNFLRNPLQGSRVLMEPHAGKIALS